MERKGKIFRVKVLLNHIFSIFSYTFFFLPRHHMESNTIQCKQHYIDYLYVHLFICLFFYKYIFSFISLFVCLFIYLFIYLFIVILENFVRFISSFFPCFLLFFLLFFLVFFMPRRDDLIITVIIYTSELCKRYFISFLIWN